VPKHYGREAWEAACKLVSRDDGLPTFETAGMWSARKLFFLCVYLEQTTRAMHGNKNFPAGLVFLDLFCGSGVTVIRTDSGSRRFPGSSVIAASLSERPFRRIVAVDAVAASLDATETRVRSTGFTGEFRRHVGDANALAKDLTAELPSGALTIAFVDPYSLDVHYSTIETLAKARPLDLIILFSDRIDLGRNVQHIYYTKQSEKLDLFLGRDSSWRMRYESLTDQSGAQLRALFAEIYREQLAKIGYGHSRAWPLEGPQGPMFSLVYASKHPLGLKFCEIALNEDFEGNRGLWGAM
jgi:three-Cys-motif partner protein